MVLRTDPAALPPVLPLPRRMGPEGVRPAGWEADLARDDVLDPDVRRFVQGMTWAAAISAPFWCALLAALIWL
jgi:hypothetical protein